VKYEKTCLAGKRSHPFTSAKEEAFFCLWKSPGPGTLGDAEGEEREFLRGLYEKDLLLSRARELYMNGEYHQKSHEREGPSQERPYPRGVHLGWRKEDKGGP